MRKSIVVLNTKKNNIKIKDNTIDKRYNILSIIIASLMILLLIRLFFIQIIKYDDYLDKVKSLSKKIVVGESTPRGRIYDRNHKLIVDNKPVKVISYKKSNQVKAKDEIALAYKLASIIDINYNTLSEYDLKKFWLKNNQEAGNSKITSDEVKQLSERKITSSDIDALKIERVTIDELNEFSELDKKSAMIYKLMTTGYYYLDKIIKDEDISDAEYARVAENLDELPGFKVGISWDRDYKYGDTFKGILGSVSTRKSGIPLELKDYYLDKGYSLDDRVGTSYLEYQYEDILKGKKEVYEEYRDGTRKKIEEGSRGKDIVLTIDIELQKAVEEILEREILSAKREANTSFYNHSFVIISDPNTGEILTMAGKQIINTNGEYKFLDYTPGILTSTVTVGSSIKGASQLVGYNTGALTIGEVRDDACIKIAYTNKKCSWKYLGRIDDLTALALSSNTYQFNTAIRVAKASYAYNAPLKINEEAFDIYRNTFAEFGLGVRTEIDLPKESTGYKGASRNPGLLLDFSIGQYDTYTPIELSQYIGTIANGGKRMKPYLLKEVYEPNNNLDVLVSKNEPIILNEINTHEEYLNRVKMGLRQVMTSGLGSSFIDRSYNAAGKTGTSQSFIDSDSDGKIDKETISNTFVAYAPFDNPRVTFTVISPDIFYSPSGSGYQTTVNKRIAYEISKKFFEFYQ